MTNETTLEELGESIGYIIEHMSTKDDLASSKSELKGDIASVGEQVSDLERDLRQVRRDLYELGEKVENILGYRKEIDHALERIAAIERHLGTDHKIVA